MPVPVKPKRASVNDVSTRTVVLLRESAKKKLKTLAIREKVSSGEIIRRSLDSYETLEARIRKEEEERTISAALDIMIEALQSANRSMEETMQRVDELHRQLHPEEAR
jgi:Sec7-like guanine-nucleotide exchange factor